MLSLVLSVNLLIVAVSLAALSTVFAPTLKYKMRFRYLSHMSEIPTLNAHADMPTSTGNCEYSDNMRRLT